MQASWVHGNALVVENPENLNRVGYMGWGADMLVKKKLQSWFHIALPTPVIVGNTRAKLLRVFLLFRVEHGMITDVHIYDGPQRIQQHGELKSKGDHLLGLDGVNTFQLASPHAVAWGIGISFLFQAAASFDTNVTPRLTVASAGGDYEV